MQVSELTGTALDWAVAQCAGIEIEIAPDGYSTYHPSRDWAQGGPIIERERIYLSPFSDYWEAQGGGVPYHDDTLQTGPTPLIAAMRCYVVSRLGEEVEVPEELK